MLTAAKLIMALEGLDPDTNVVVGIIEGPRYNAAYANQHVSEGVLTAYICCDDTPRPSLGANARVVRRHIMCVWPTVILYHSWSGNA